MYDPQEVVNIAAVDKNSLSGDILTSFETHLWPSASPLPQAQQNDVAGRFPLPFGLQTTYRIFKTDSESLFPDDSGHIFSCCLAPSWAKKTRLENGGTDPRGFAAAETGFCRGKTSRISVVTF